MCSGYTMPKVPRLPLGGEELKITLSFLHSFPIFIHTLFPTQVSVRFDWIWLNFLASRTEGEIWVRGGRLAHSQRNGLWTFRQFFLSWRTHGRVSWNSLFHAWDCSEPSPFVYHAWRIKPKVVFSTVPEIFNFWLFQNAVMLCKQVRQYEQLSDDKIK